MINCCYLLDIILTRKTIYEGFACLLKIEADNLISYTSIQKKEGQMKIIILSVGEVIKR